MRGELGCMLAAVGLLAGLPAGGQEAPLPVTRVVLFRSGVGYLERSGTVVGEASLTLNFKVEQVNDLLKSLVLQDLDGGRVRPVSYAPRDPVARTLQSFAIDLSDHPDLAELVSRLRGVVVEVRQATRSLSGRVVGVEERSVYDREGQTLTSAHQLTLATGEGLETVSLEQVQGLRILDERLRGEFESALATLASGLDNTRKSVRLGFEGEGERRVRVGYIQEMPVWKMSYRLVLGEGEAPFLQGWAIVENTSEEDWEAVELSLVSGRPVSFIMDLYQPLYLPRPQVQPRLWASLQPRAYEGAVEEKAREEVSTLARRRLAGRDEPAAAPEAPPMADALALGLAPARGARPGAAFEPSASVASMASAQELGALFEYRIDQLVSLARQRSALIPIVNEEVGGEEVSVYNPASHPRFPLYGLRLSNTTGLTLMEGPVTVFARGAYGGDALIEDIEPGGERLLTYALDLKLEVSSEDQSKGWQPGGETVVSYRIVRGVLVETHRLRTRRVYTVRNRDLQARALLVEHPVQEGWELVEPERFDEKTAQFYRFRVEAPAGETVALAVVEEREQQQVVELTKAAPDQVTIYLRNPRATEALQTALREVQRRQREIGRLQAEVEQRRARVEEIAQDQGRIRQNMERLDRQSDLYQRYVRTLNDQEDELGRLRDESEELQARLAGERQGLEDYLRELNVE